MGTILPQTLLVSFPIPARFCFLGLTNCQTMEPNGAQCLSNALTSEVGTSRIFDFATSPELTRWESSAHALCG